MVIILADTVQQFITKFIQNFGRYFFMFDDQTVNGFKNRVGLLLFVNYWQGFDENYCKLKILFSHS